MTDSRHYDAIAIGGGPAGCAAAIRAASLGLRTLLLERKTYPAPKLCGEFLSVEAASYLADLGALDRALNGPHARIRWVRLIAAGGAAVRRPLPGEAIGLTRDRLDHALFEAASAAGAHCCSAVCVDRVDGSLAEGFRVQAGRESWRGRIVFGAYGKRAALDRALDRPVRPSDLLAFKWRLDDPASADGIEVFGFQDGYAGLCPIGEGHTNLCLIARRAALERAQGSAAGLLSAACRRNSGLCDRLSICRQIGKPIGCSSIALGAKPPFARGGVCMIGDTAAMIAPLCGDGMSMAMRSAQIAVGAAEQHLVRTRDPERFRRAYASRWRREFGSRLLLGRALQAAALSTVLSSRLVGACSVFPGLADMLVRATRDCSRAGPLTRRPEPADGAPTIP